MLLRRLRLSRSSALILLGFVGLALLLDFLFFTGYYASDDIFYLEGAQSIADGNKFYPELGNVRLGITLPSALVYWITGSIDAVTWFFVVYHVGLVILAYALGRLLHGERAGRIAACLAAINPLYYVFAGAVLPDNATSFWLGLTLIVLVVTRQRAHPGEGLLSWNRARFVGYMSAGVLLGLTYTCKETALIMTIPAAVFIMTSPPGIRNLVWIQNGAALALGLVIVVVLDYVALRIVVGEWISRLEMVSKAGALFVKEMQEHSSPFERVHFAYNDLKELIPFTLWLLVAGSIAYGFVRDRRPGIVMFFWWPVVYLTVGTTSFTTYIPATVQSRYYAIALLPAIVVTAAVIGAVMQAWSNRGTAWSHRVGAHVAVAGVLLLVGGWEACKNAPQGGMIYRANEVRAFVHAVELARERYPQYAIVASSYYLGRFRPVLYDEPAIRRDPNSETPPFLFIDIVDRSEASRVALETPTRCARRLHDIRPPRSRPAIVADAVRRVFSVTSRHPIRVARERFSKNGAALILVEPREANQPCRSGP